MDKYNSNNHLTNTFIMNTLIMKKFIKKTFYLIQQAASLMLMPRAQVRSL